MAVNIRPTTLSEYIGQEEVKKKMSLYITCFKKKGLSFPHTLIFSNAGKGKAQPLDSLVLTKNGYIRMGDVKVGTKVLDGKGSETTVLGVFPQGVRDIYSISFSDGTSIEVSDEHINTVFRYNNSKRQNEYMELTTKELLNYMNTQDRKGFHLRVPLPTLNCWEDTNLPINPYLMGIILAEGCIIKNEKLNAFRITLPEEDIKNKVGVLLNKEGYTLVPVAGHKGHNKYDYYMTMIEHKHIGSLQKKFNDLGLRCNSLNKFIPKQYLFTSIENRLELLRGLFDGDGYIGKYTNKRGYICGNYEYTTCSKQLSEDFSFLVRSLGIVDRVIARQAHYTDKSGIRHYTSTKYRHTLKVPNGLTICSSIKHLDHLYTREFEPIRKIISVDYVGKKECQCIYVESSEHTYITDNVTVTHNTTLARCLAGELGVDFIEVFGPTLKTAEDFFRVLSNGGKRLKDNVILFIDECLSGDTEVLTENGWVRLDQYNGKDKVLQWEENGEMSFVVPSRIVKSRWEKVYKLPFRNGVMYQTPNHRNPVMHKKVWRGVKYEFRVRTPEQLSANDKFICTGKIKGCTKHLTLLEKLIIMTQADGAVNRRVSGKFAASWSISLSKERKLQYLSTLLKDKDISSFSFREVKGREARGKVKATRRFLYSMPIGNGDYKDLTKYFNLLDFDYTKAREFMQNVFIWDGAEYPSGNIYCTTEKRNAEFVQAVGMLAGYQTSISMSHDKRGYKDYYRVYFADNDNPISCQKTSIKRELVDWNDYMYCLTVPSSFFVIRKNGKTFITGNCHSVPTEVLELLYGLMEDGIIIIGSKAYRLPPITVIGGTTSAGKIPKPLYTRFIEKCVLVDYTDDELTQMGMITASKLGLNIEEDAVRKLVPVCSKTPRVLNNLIRAAQVYCIAYDIDVFRSSDVLSFLSFQGINGEGFNTNDKVYLKILFNNIIDGVRQPIGFNSICKKGNLIKDEVENLIEPKLLLKEFITFSGKGRYLTDKGLEYVSKL